MRRDDQLAAVDQRHGRRKRPRVKHERNDKDEHWPQEWLAEERLICIRIHGNAGKQRLPRDDIISNRSRSMRRRIKRMAALQTGKMLGVFYGCKGLLFLPFFAVASAATALAHHPQQAQDASGPPAVFIALMTCAVAGVCQPSLRKTSRMAASSAASLNGL